MISVRQTAEFSAWLAALNDIRAREKIAIRIARVQAGLLGDVKFFDGIGELRIDYGPGYRVYFVQHGAVLVVLLCAGDKSQSAPGHQTGYGHGKGALNGNRKHAFRRC